MSLLCGAEQEIYICICDNSLTEFALHSIPLRRLGDHLMRQVHVLKALPPEAITSYTWD
jgi:hypothetical protein